MKKLSPSTIAMLRHGFIDHKGQRWRREEKRRWKCIAKVLMQDWAMQADRILGTRQKENRRNGINKWKLGFNGGRLQAYEASR